jgi:nucleoside-diphosphate-sugar epimerase
MTGMLLTGATGFVGGEALLRYIERAPNHHFFLMVRARDDEHLAVRAEKLLNAHFKDTKEAVRSRLTFFRGNLLKPGLAISEEDRAMLVEKVDHVVHCAASVDFGMGLEESRQFNLEGTRKVLELCEEIHRAGHFNRLDYVSTAYVAGSRTDIVPENELSTRGLGWANFYEQSKFEAESMVRGWRSQGFPVAIYRPSTVVGDSRTGETSNFNVLYWPLRVYARGWWNMMIGFEDTPVDVVPINYVVDCLVNLSLKGDSTIGRDYHLTAGPEKVCHIRDLAEHASKWFGQPYPKIVSPEKFDKIYKPAIDKNATPAQRELIKQGLVYMPYFSRSPLFDTSNVVADLEGTGTDPVMPVVEYFEVLFKYCVETDWGKKSVKKAVAGEGASEDAADIGGSAS